MIIFLFHMTYSSDLVQLTVLFRVKPTCPPSHGRLRAESQPLRKWAQWFYDLNLATQSA